METASVSDIHNVKETSIVHNNGHSTLTAGSLSFYSHGFIVIYHAFLHVGAPTAPPVQLTLQEVATQANICRLDILDQ